MSIEADRQQAAATAYSYYNKALTTGLPIGPGAPVSSFFDERTGVYHFFSPGRVRYVTYSKLMHPEYYTRLVSQLGPSYPGPGREAFPGRGAYSIYLPNDLHEAYEMFNYAVMRPNEFSYAAVFDMRSPTWSIPLNEWPQGHQASVGASWY
jgi:hypothetical protein